MQTSRRVRTERHEAVEPPLQNSLLNDTNCQRKPQRWSRQQISVRTTAARPSKAEKR